MAAKVKSSEERIEKRLHFLKDKPLLLDHTLYRYPREKLEGIGHALSNSDLGTIGNAVKGYFLSLSFNNFIFL